MNLSEAITAYISYRQSLGENFHTNGGLLKQFRSYLAKDEPVEDITEAQTSGFLLSGNGQVTRKWFTRHTALLGFFKWCLARGYVINIPLTMDKPKAPPHIVPYIYSDDELRRLFSAATAYQGHQTVIYPECVKAILQVTYVLGLRISETMALRMKHVDLSSQCVTIHQSKFFTSRVVTFNNEVKSLFEKFFMWRISQKMSTDEDCSLWIRRDGTPMRLWSMKRIFKRVRRKAGISRNDNPIYQPRIHDLRHTFAVNRLRSWYKEGKDVQCLLPALSTYLGHKQVSYTSVYLTMTPGLMADANKLFYEYTTQKTNPDE